MNWIGLGQIGKATCNRPKPKLFLQKTALKEKLEWTTGTYSNRLNDKFFENLFVSKLLWPLKLKNNDKGREKTYIEWEQKILVFSCMKRFGKKHEMLQMFPFCVCLLFLSWPFICRFRKIFDESGRKIVDMSGKKLEKCLYSKPFNCTKKKEQKSGKRTWHFSSSEVHTICGILMKLVCNTFSEWCRKC